MRTNTIENSGCKNVTVQRAEKRQIMQWSLEHSLAIPLLTLRLFCRDNGGMKKLYGLHKQ